MPERPQLRILLGPTASGKERTALLCAEALGGEIISVDSMKIYRHLDVGTAKASQAMRDHIRHHGLDLAEPTETFSVARYVAAAEAAIDDITARGKIPILSGGTALYYKGLLEGLFDGPEADPALRATLRARAEAEGGEAIHRELSEKDPTTAARLHPNDLRRVIRALEVIAVTGQPISTQQTQWRGGTFTLDATPAYRYPVSMVALHWPRPMLYERIGERVDRMMRAGLLEEARLVYHHRETYARTPLQAVGYKEFFPYFAGESSLEEAVDTLKKNTRHLAKSQMTWFRKFPCTWIDLAADDTPAEVAPRVLAAWG